MEGGQCDAENGGGEREGGVEEWDDDCEGIGVELCACGSGGLGVVRYFLRGVFVRAGEGEEVEMGICALADYTWKKVRGRRASCAAFFAPTDPRRRIRLIGLANSVKRWNVISPLPFSSSSNSPLMISRRRPLFS